MIYTVTLTPTATPNKVSDLLDEDAGAYGLYLFFYVARLGNQTQQSGEMMINDSGQALSFDHEFNTLPSNANPFLTFTVVYEDGKRRLKYTLAGSVNVTFNFSIERKL